MRSGIGSHSEPDANLFQTEMRLHRKTEKGVLLSDDGEKENAKWLPLSQLTMTPAKSRGHYIVTMPEWLAKKHDFI